jgi:cyclic beta-1,2-glucan synthetase
MKTADTNLEEQSPLTHVLASGEYSLLITAAGSGYSRWRDIALTRWRGDPTCDAQGLFLYLKDVANGRVWSAGYQPVGREPDSYEVTFTEEGARILRADGPILTSTEILISPEDDTEVRRVHLTNSGRSTREIELTSYAEVVLADPAGDFAHPAFSKMFVQTEFVADGGGTLLATRRHRETGEAPLWMFHIAVLEGEGVGALQFETDRARFLGRGGDVRTAVSILDALPLSDTAGTVLDPVFALRRRTRIPPGGTAQVDFWTGVAGSRAQALAAATKYRDAGAFERIAAAAAGQARAELEELEIDADAARRFQRIAGYVLYPDCALRAPQAILAGNESGPSLLWACGISGDLPIVLVHLEADGGVELVKELLRARQRSVPALEFFNGFGGFAAAGREYVTVLEGDQWTPAPWTNVIANPQFGFLVSADGAGSTWSMNARENQLSPWSNDPVSNSPAEVIYIRDEASGELWSATPLPIREQTDSVCGPSWLRL